MIEKIAESPLFTPPNHSLYKARLAKPSELRSLTGTLPEQETSLLLGVDGHGKTIRIRPTEQFPELGNILIDGQTRRGKGLLLTTQLKTWPHSVVVNDIKGDLSDLTAEMRSKMGEGLFCRSPGGWRPLRSTGRTACLRTSCAPRQSSCYLIRMRVKARSSPNARSKC